MRHRLIVVTVIAGMVALSGVAAAAEGEREDTVFNFAYDEENEVLLWNHNPNDGLYDCTLENGALNASYGLTDGQVNVDALTDETDATVSFEPTPEEDLADGLDPAEDPFEYAGADDECGVSGAVVAGPNGQINHGMFMKLFNAMFDGQKRGCLNRHLAHSDLGKGDQQVRVGDVDADAEGLSDGDTGVVTFQTAVADCLNEDKLTGQEKAAEKKAEKAAAKADKQRGKSAQAPGRNK